MEEWTRLLAEYWPGLTLATALCFGVYMIVRFVSLTSDEALGSVGNYFRAKRAISQADAHDLKKRLVYLDQQVRRLRYRDECYFAYMLTDQEWHRRHELLAAAQGWTFDRHVTFLEFRERWMRERGLDKEPDLWM